MRRWCWWFGGLLLLACPSEDSALSQLGSGCVLDSDCDGSLVCVFDRCNQACVTSLDCPAGARCVDGGDAGICQVDAPCGLNSDCPGSQVCAVDATCRDQCKAAEDCRSGQVCAKGVCAESEEVGDDGALAEQTTAGEGAPCVRASDCEVGMRCLEGKCLYECMQDVDCPSGICRENHCIPGPPSAPECAPGQQRSCPNPVQPCTTPEGLQACTGAAAWGQCRCVPPSGMGGGGMTGTTTSTSGAGGAPTTTTATSSVATTSTTTSSVATTTTGGLGGMGVGGVQVAGAPPVPVPVP